MTTTLTAGTRRPRLGRLIGVGVGPGDPELVTTKALRVIAESDRVVAPTTSLDSVGRAEAIVRQASPGTTIERLVFEMTRTGDGAPGTARPGGGSGPGGAPNPGGGSGTGGAADPAAASPTRSAAADTRAASQHRAAVALLAWLDAGEQVAFVTLGDPNMYSTFSSLAASAVVHRPGLEVITVPGIMAFQALAARTGTVLLDATDTLTLVTALDGPAHLEAALSRGEDAVVVYKGGRHLPAVAGALERFGRLEGAVLGELLGLPGERVCPVAEVAERPASYLATVIVPPTRRGIGR